VQAVRRARKSATWVILLVGNKIDLEAKRAVSREESEDFAKSHDLQYIETSAAENIGIEEAFVRTATTILKRSQTLPTQGTPPGPQRKSESGSKCPC
jgi:GTPase SAR1 family protein